jgi:DNA-binding transcriptional MerR regulator
MPDPISSLPHQPFFRIGEVARVADVEPYVLRFWETEFPMLRPTKSQTGQRLYRRSDVEIVLQIRTLLYDQGFTIAGARKHIQEEMNASKTTPPLPLDSASDQATLHAIRKELRDLLALLSQPR